MRRTVSTLVTLLLALVGALTLQASANSEAPLVSAAQAAGTGLNRTPVQLARKKPGTRQTKKAKQSAGPTVRNRRGATPMSDAYEKEIQKWTNYYRAQRGLAPLRILDCIDAFAEDWANYMAATTTFAHQDASKFYRCRSGRLAGENIVMGYEKPKDVVDAWMASAPHRANLLSTRFTHIGIGSDRSAADGAVYTSQTFFAVR